MAKLSTAASIYYPQIYYKFITIYLRTIYTKNLEKQTNTYNYEENKLPT